MDRICPFPSSRAPLEAEDNRTFSSTSDLALEGVKSGESATP